MFSLNVCFVNDCRLKVISLCLSLSSLRFVGWAAAASTLTETHNELTLEATKPLLVVL